MCMASLSLENAQSAKVGQRVQVVSGHGHGTGKLFAFEGAPSGLCCIPTGAVVRFVSLPLVIRDRIGWWDSPVEARMVSYDAPRKEFATNRDDAFETMNENRTRFMLGELPYGTVCEILRIEPVPQLTPTRQSHSRTPAAEREHVVVR